MTTKILNFTQEFWQDVNDELRMKELSDQPENVDENTYIQMLKIWRNGDMKLDIEPLQKSKKGVLIAYKSKKLMKENRGIKVTDLNSVIELQPTHWTANSYFYPSIKREKGVITGNSKEHLNQINCLPIDVDSNTVSWQTALKISKKSGLDPLCIIVTDKGYQLIYSISGACYFNKSNKESLFGVLDRVYNNVRRTLINSGVPIDTHCHPYGVCRFPKRNKTVYINLKNNKTYREWIEWSCRHDTSNDQKPVLALKTSGIPAWARAIANCKSLEKGDRNVALYACALAYKDAGVDETAATEELSEWITSMGTPVTEARRTIKSAYLDKFHASSEYYNPIVEKYNLTVKKASRHIENWKEALTDRQKKAYWAIRKPAKKREDRTRSHYSEWQDDLLDWLETHNNEKTTWAKIMEEIGISRKSLSKVLDTLREQGVITIESKKGRYGYLIIRKIAAERQEQQQQVVVNGIMGIVKTDHSETTERRSDTS